MTDVEQLETQVVAVEEWAQTLRKRCHAAETTLAEVQFRLGALGGLAEKANQEVQKHLKEIKASVYEGYRVARELQDDNAWVKQHQDLLVDLQGLVQQLDSLYGTKRRTRR